MYLSNKCVSQNQCQVPVMGTYGFERTSFFFFIIKKLFTILGRGMHTIQATMAVRGKFLESFLPFHLYVGSGVKLSLQGLLVEAQNHFVS